MLSYCEQLAHVLQINSNKIRDEALGPLFSVRFSVAFNGGRTFSGLVRWDGSRQLSKNIGLM